MAPPVQRPEPQHEEDGRRAEQEEAWQRALRAGLVAVVVAVLVSGLSREDPVVDSFINATH